MLAAHKKHVKTLIHEQNSVVGVSNKMVAKYMDAIIICYEKCYEEFGKEKTYFLGNPRAQTQYRQHLMRHIIALWVCQWRNH